MCNRTHPSFLHLSERPDHISRTGCRNSGIRKDCERKTNRWCFYQRVWKTDETGHFKIAFDVLIRYWKTLIFDRKVFVPKTVSLDASNRNLTITLESETDNSVWDLPSCSADKVNWSRFVGQ